MVLIVVRATVVVVVTVVAVVGIVVGVVFVVVVTDSWATDGVMVLISEH